MTPQRRIRTPARTAPAPRVPRRKPSPTPADGARLVAPGIAPAPSAPGTILWLQHRAGNTAVSRLSFPGVMGRGPVQRHPPGFRPSIDPERAASQLQGGAGSEPAEATAAPAVGPGGAGGAGGAAAPAAPRPRALRNEAMTLATAESALTRSFGRIRRIVPVPVTILDHAGILRAYDDDCIRRGVLYTDPRTGATRPWRRGDADPGIEGFALVDSSRIYVQSDTVLPTATAHELLHANTARDFRGAVGEAINEGTTEHLAIKALTAAGLPTEGPTGARAYPDQVTAVQQLIRVVGEDTLTEAYFGGAATLVSAYEALMPHTFALLRGTGSLDTAHMAALLVPRTAAQKVALIRARLATTPTAADCAAIRAICNSDAADIPAIRAGVFADINRVVTDRLDAGPSPLNREVIGMMRSLPCADRAALSGPLVFRVLPRVSDNSTGADFTAIRDLCERDPAGVPTVRAVIAPAITGLANERLNGWVSDADLDFITALYRLPVADQASMRASLGPRTSELWSLGQRMRLRVLLAGGR